MDAFGEGLMAFYRGDRTPHVIRRDDGYVSEVGFDPYFAEYDAWSEDEKKALEHVRGRVLDIGCGAGRHSIWLQQRGFEVVAIDISPLAVEVARLRGVRDCLVMSAQCLSFPPNLFDTVLLMGNNFGVAGNAEETKKMFKNLYRTTLKEARVIASCRDPLAAKKPEHLRYHEVNRKRGRPIGQLTLRFEYKDKIGDWFDLLIVPPSAMAEICKDAGWKVIEVFLGKDGTYSSVLKKVSYSERIRLTVENAPSLEDVQETMAGKLPQWDELEGKADELIERAVKRQTGFSATISPLSCQGSPGFNY